MKKIIEAVLISLLLSTIITACGKDNKKQQEKFAKLKLIAQQINVAIDSEVTVVQAFIDSKPKVGKDKSTVEKLQDYLDTYARLKIDIPSGSDYSTTELDTINTELKEAIDYLNNSLLDTLDIENNSLENIEKYVLDKDLFDALFPSNCPLKVIFEKITEQRRAVSEAVDKEEERIAKKEKAKADAALKKKKAACIKNGGWWEDGKCEYGGYAKPVLYLYPTKKTDIRVTFAKPQLLTTTYPKYVNAWEITAYPNGDLYDKNNKYYYALYWEEDAEKAVDFSSGFYVEGQDAIKFLEEKLTIIGLGASERNEFIMYWLPIMEANGKNLVYFELTEERQSGNKLIIQPQPDSLLRVAIHLKKVEQKVKITEQKLSQFRRKGFVAVEWGGVLYN